MLALGVPRAPVLCPVPVLVHGDQLYFRAKVLRITNSSASVGGWMVDEKDCLGKISVLNSVLYSAEIAPECHSSS